MRIRRYVGACALAGVLSVVCAVPSGATGPGLARYSVKADVVTVEQVDAWNSPCGTPGTVTFDQHISATGAATVAGLSDEDFLALVADDPDGVVRQVTVTSHGTVTLETGGHTYRGTFTQRFGGQFLPNGMYIQSGTFSVEARSELGTKLSAHSGGHDVDGFDGATKMFNQHGSVTGCLP